jgi:hypothetical protein
MVAAATAQSLDRSGESENGKGKRKGKKSRKGSRCGTYSSPSPVAATAAALLRSRESTKSD